MYNGFFSASTSGDTSGGDTGDNNTGSDSGGTEGDNGDNTTGDSSDTSIDFSSGGVFSWIAQGFSNVVQSITSVIDYINPFSENFILKGVLDFLGSILDFLNPFSENFFGIKIIEGIGDALEAIFVPDEDAINNLINTVRGKFAFIDTIHNTIETLKSMFVDTTEFPKMTITLPENKWKSGEVTLIDLSWYAPYKPYGDTIISAFIYIFFVWRTFIHLPSIINGVGGNVEYLVTTDFDIEKQRSGKK